MISSLHVLFTVLSAFMIMICHWYGRTSPSTEPLKVYIPPPQHIHHLAFGYKESMADGFWLRAIQDFEVCGGAESDGRSSTELIVSGK